MIDATLRIKNLSISLEALSRINLEGSSLLYVEIEALLGQEIENLQKEQNTVLTARPAMPPIGYDDIPF